MVTLVTGQRGFTGSYLTQELLAHGHEVVALKANLLDPDAVCREILNVRPTIVFHLAGISFVNHTRVQEVYSVNVNGTYNLLDALARLRASPSSVVLASSATVYGSGGSDLLSETAPLNPSNHYGVSKLAMEYMARCFVSELPVVIARPFNYTGVNQNERFLIPKIVAHFKQRTQDIELGNIDVFREFSDVRTVVTQYRRLSEANPIGETINICSGKTYSIRQVIDLAESLTGHHINIKKNSAFTRHNEIKVLGGDPNKLQKLIDSQEMHTLNETLEWMLAS